MTQDSTRVTTYSPTNDYFPDKSQSPRTHLLSTQPTPLLNAGIPTPNTTTVPRTNTTITIQIPATNLDSLAIAIAIAIAIAAVSYIKMLGKQVAIKAVDTEELVSSPYVQAELEKGTIERLEDPNSTLRVEQMKKVNVVYSSYGVDIGTENKTVT
ncbi:hypothetical protein EC957_000932 [Mortierella hygrophila]|uniref:Uncharacterized protein n=1 Tax=Mortierella hygrophila TaxID=979708 RepID=A0A9P6F6W8_9FUNG|nr:hypothetical protein EC957_000932 [Mortierella hygrophila]